MNQRPPADMGEFAQGNFAFLGGGNQLLRNVSAAIVIATVRQLTTDRLEHNVQICRHASSNSTDAHSDRGLCEIYNGSVLKTLIARVQK